ncbi:rhodanese-like domain-containing protein, partial [Listeria monocytogenes]|uniref:rhodanese-like domain-containing protein n=1 Tax=Listeria monocytogenes TaxID=1639 RepID=UPI003FA45E3E
MVFGFGKSAKHREIEPQELAAMVQANQVLVVDVREVDEFANGRIPGAINMPLSTFQPSKLPDPGARQLVLT